MSHPRVYAKLQAEIEGAVRSGTASTGVVSDAEARGVPYLVAVVREALRVSLSMNKCCGIQRLFQFAFVYTVPQIMLNCLALFLLLTDYTVILGTPACSQPLLPNHT